MTVCRCLAGEAELGKPCFEPSPVCLGAVLELRPLPLAWAHRLDIKPASTVVDPCCCHLGLLFLSRYCVGPRTLVGRLLPCWPCQLPSSGGAAGPWCSPTIVFSLLGSSVCEFLIQNSWLLDLRTSAFRGFLRVSVLNFIV